MFCLSKALGAPVGSLLAGTQETIAQARLYRKRLGGGMRQAGVLAAAGLIALEQTPATLAEDHRNARFLANGLAEISGIKVNAMVPSNIVIFDVSGTGLAPSEISGRLRERGVLINGVSPTHMRAVTHFDVDRGACEAALRAVAEVTVRHHAAQPSL
jgi:threonine aldolase